MASPLQFGAGGEADADSPSPVQSSESTPYTEPTFIPTLDKSKRAPIMPEMDTPEAERQHRPIMLQKKTALV